MVHVVAILGLSLMCVLWFLVQRATGRVAGCSGNGDGSCGRKHTDGDDERKGGCLYCGSKNHVD